MADKNPKKRKPRRKRKLVEPTQPNDIPYSKYRIEWIDILSDSGWATDKEFDRMKLATPVNEGWLYELPFSSRFSSSWFSVCHSNNPGCVSG